MGGEQKGNADGNCGTGRQDEKEKRMQQKYGAVGRIVARSTRTTLDPKWPVCSLALANSGG